MQIEVGEYETRCGKDVIVVAIVDSIAIGYFLQQGPEIVTSWRADNGRHFVQTQCESALDLVRKKPKRVKREAWLTIYGERVDSRVVGGGYPTKAIAQENKREDCIAIVRVEIDCGEGENLD